MGSEGEGQGILDRAPEASKIRDVAIELDTRWQH